MKNIGILLVLLITNGLWAQSDSSKVSKKPKISFDGIVEAYYAYDFDNPVSKEKQGFLFSHNRHNEFNINLALIRANLDGEWYRGKIGVGFGSFMRYNMGHEPAYLRNIYEAYAGVRLTKGLWLDVGVLPSHLGFESAISTDNLTLTRSLAAENSPYYLTGARLSYQTPNEQWSFAALVCNGWQNIAENNSFKSVGWQVGYKPTEKIAVNYSGYFGDDSPDSTEFYLFRLFHNLYTTMEFGEHVRLAAGVDFGSQQQITVTDTVGNIIRGRVDWVNWLAPVLIAQYRLNDQWQFAARAEYFLDLRGVIMPREETEILGFSLNVDYSPFKYATFRLEGRFFQSFLPVFEFNNGLLTNQNFSITASAAIRF